MYDYEQANYRLYFNNILNTYELIRVSLVSKLTVGIHIRNVNILTLFCLNTKSHVEIFLRI